LLVVELVEIQVVLVVLVVVVLVVIAVALQAKILAEDPLPKTNFRLN
jgi:hypothetical protein